MRAVSLHRKDKKVQLGMALLICTSYACFDEFHQSLVPGRGPSLIDVMIDSAGALTGIFVYHILISRVYHFFHTNFMDITH